MKARLEYFRMEAESKLPPLSIQEPLIRVRRNLHPPFLGEALQYMRDFHKNHSSNDLYGLSKACQDTIDLVLTCPDAERIIQKNSNPRLKAKFQHICEVESSTLMSIHILISTRHNFPFLLRISSIYDTISKSFQSSLSSALQSTKWSVLHN